MKTSRSYIVAAHIAGWLIFLSITISFLFSQGPEGNSVFERPEKLVYFLIYPIIFYANTKFLFPQLFLKGKYFLYTFFVLFLLASVIYLRPFDSQVKRNDNFSRNTTIMPPGPPPSDHLPGEIPPGPPPNNNNMKKGPAGPAVDIISVGIFLLVMTASISVVLVQKWTTAARRASEAEAYKSKAELASLKAQINPHFLFNTLNNIYSLALTKDDNTAECIMMLSNIMRYVTDEATQEMVPLQNEADCIRDFIELNKIRLGSKIRFNYSLGGEMQGKTIAPLLLITFVENVFKYGISNNEISEINIYLVTDKKKISFFCQNKLVPKTEHTESTGVGIANAGKRLEYLYPGKHELTIKDDDGYYTVHLSIEI